MDDFKAAVVVGVDRLTTSSCSRVVGSGGGTRP